MKTLMTICATAIALAVPGRRACKRRQRPRQASRLRSHYHERAVSRSSPVPARASAERLRQRRAPSPAPTALATGTFAASLSTNWSAATTKTFDQGTLSCAPATATITLTGATTTNTVSSPLTGKTCAWTKTDGTVVRTFFGKGAVTAAGMLAPLTGSTGKAFLFQKADGTVSGAVFAGRHEAEGLTTFAVREHEAAHKTGDCDHHKTTA